MVATRLFFSLFVGTILLSNTFAKNLELIRIPDGISYFDINGDGVKDMIVSAYFVTPFGGNIYNAYSFYIKSRDTLSYAPIQSKGGDGAKAVIYTYSKVGGCGAPINKEEITYISDIRMLKKGQDMYLLFVDKDCPDSLSIFKDKCKFEVVVYRYNKKVGAFDKYKEAKTNKPYCDARQVFSNEKMFLLSLIK